MTQNIKKLTIHEKNEYQWKEFLVKGVFWAKSPAKGLIKRSGSIFRCFGISRAQGGVKNSQKYPKIALEKGKTAKTL